MNVNALFFIPSDIYSQMRKHLKAILFAWIAARRKD